MPLDREVEVIAAVVIVEVFVDSGNSLVVGFVFSTVVADAGIFVLDLWVVVVLLGVVGFPENRHKLIIYPVGSYVFFIFMCTTCFIVSGFCSFTLSVFLYLLFVECTFAVYLLLKSF